MSDAVIITVIICASLVILGLFGGKKGDKK